MRINTFILLPLLFVAAVIELRAQDPVFSQFYHAPTQLNPALTGISHAPRFCLNYRNQYPQWPVNAYSTFQASYDQFFDRANSGVGLSVMNDREGDGIYNTTTVMGTYAYSVQVSDNFYMRGGLEASFVSHRLNWDKLYFYDQLNPAYGLVDPVTGSTLPSQEIRPNATSANYLDLGTGLLAYSKGFHIGMSLKHINAPDRGFLRGRSDSQVPMRFTMHAGGEIKLGKGGKIGKTAIVAPNALYSTQRGLNQLTIGAYVKYGVVFGGAWYRHAFGNPDATIFLAGIQKGVLKIGYSYDFTVSNLQGAGGSHELSLIINLEESEHFKKRRNKHRFDNCLQMFR